MDPGRDPTAGFFSGLIVAGTLNIWCTKRSGPSDTAVQQWLLAIDRDHIGIGLSFESAPIRTMSVCSNHVVNTDSPTFTSYIGRQ